MAHGKLGRSGEGVEIDEAALGKDAQVITAVCFAHLRETDERLYVACSKEDVSIALTVYKERPGWRGCG